MVRLMVVNKAMLTGKELGRAIESARVKKGVSKAELARAFGVKPPSVQGWVNHGRISKDKLSQLMDYFADTVPAGHWGEKQRAKAPATIAKSVSSPGIQIVSDPGEHITIPRLDVSASMGAGLARTVTDEVVEQISVHREWLRRNVNATAPGNLALLDAKGDSMEGTFSDGDLLLVDRGISEVKVDAVYVLALDDELFIKRLQRRPDGTMLMLSDNPKYPPYELKNGDLSTFQVLGRVLLAWNARRL